MRINCWVSKIATESAKLLQNQQNCYSISKTASKSAKWLNTSKKATKPAKKLQNQQKSYKTSKKLLLQQQNDLPTCKLATVSAKLL